jgi:hypothetical protein
MWGDTNDVMNTKFIIELQLIGSDETISCFKKFKIKL